MTALALLALALGLPAAAGDAPCVQLDDLHLEEAVSKAQQLAVSCAAQGAMPKALADQIASWGVGKGPQYHCGYKLDVQAVTRRRDGGTHISVDMDKARPAEATSVREPRAIDLTVFHELVHAADPGDRLFSLFAHNHALGFPDGVYGCEYACGGFVDPESFGPAYTGLFEAMVRAVPQETGYPCPGGASDCRLLRQYAWLCRHGAPKLTDDEKLGLRVYEATLCLKDYADAIDASQTLPAARKVAAVRDAKRSGAADERRVELIAGYTKALGWILKDGSWLDKAWLSSFLDAHDCPSLP